MSYPSNLTVEEKEFWDLRMQMPIKKGSIVGEGSIRYKLLEDATAHSCPFVIPVDESGKEIEGEEKRAMTLYEHSGVEAEEWARNEMVKRRMENMTPSEFVLCKEDYTRRIEGIIETASYIDINNDRYAKSLEKDIAALRDEAQRGFIIYCDKNFEGDEKDEFISSMEKFYRILARRLDLSMFALCCMDMMTGERDKERLMQDLESVLSTCKRKCND